MNKYLVVTEARSTYNYPEQRVQRSTDSEAEALEVMEKLGGGCQLYVHVETRSRKVPVTVEKTIVEVVRAERRT